MLSIRRLFSHITLVGVFFIALVLPVFAARADQASVSTENVTASLLSERESLMPGVTNWVVVHQKIRPGWHTYWLNPGDSGLATRLEWTLPAGFAAGDISWPAPHYFEVGGLANNGYTGDVGLLVPVSVPQGAAGSRARLAVKASWLVCETICVPEEVDLALDLPVGKQGQETAVAPEAAGVFHTARVSLPQPTAGAIFAIDGRKVAVSVPFPGEGSALAPDAKVRFFANLAGVVEPAGVQSSRIADGRLIIEMATPDAAVAPPVLDGVITIDGESRLAFAIAAPPGRIGASGATDLLGLLAALGLAFLGGLLLNLMPCVLPVLSIKALGLVGHGRDAHGKLRAQGLAYGAGILVTFALVGATVLALKAGGEAVGWGFQLQSPTVVGLLAYLLFVIGLSLAGALPSLGGGIAGVGQSLADRSGLAGSFFTGALAVLVATPCTAPFMGTALGYAFVASWPAAMATFLALGLGLAAPFVVLAFSPALVRHLPRPGAWMERLRQALAFPMFASAVWLVWVLARQAGPDAVLIVLAGAVLLAFAAWVLRAGQAGGHHAGRQMMTRGLALVSVVLALAIVQLPETRMAPAPAHTTGNWERFSPGGLKALCAAGRPIFVNVTAARCLTCIVNERVALSDPAVTMAFADRGVALVEADWTRRDPEITELLASFGRSGVPLYLVFPPGGGPPRVLPQMLTPSIVLNALAAP